MVTGGRCVTRGYGCTGVGEGRTVLQKAAHVCNGRVVGIRTRYRDRIAGPQFSSITTAHRPSLSAHQNHIQWPFPMACRHCILLSLPLGRECGSHHISAQNKASGQAFDTRIHNSWSQQYNKTHTSQLRITTQKKH